jgi:hypothetical protein
MIEGLQSLGRNPLPAITTLNLRSNRLSSLAGIERLLSLERVDFRDNNLSDPTELARLTVIPDMTEIYVHRNPFCKSYPNYRVTIFNLFRKTPGYTEDVVIDSTGPSNAEKKQLVDRAPELPGVPVVKPPVEDDMPPPYVPPKVVKAIDSTTEDPDRLRRSGSLQRQKSARSSQATGGSQRKKKGPKRRIVELSHAEQLQQSTASGLTGFSYDDTAPRTPPRIQKTTAEVTQPDKPRFEEPKDGTVTGDPVKRPSLDERVVIDTTHTTHQQLPPIDTSTDSKAPQLPEQEFDVSNDLYKKKIEALREDFGNTWLTALGDESWDSAASGLSPDRGYASPTIRPAIPRTPSQGIVSGGRTLGWSSQPIDLITFAIPKRFVFSILTSALASFRRWQTVLVLVVFLLFQFTQIISLLHGVGWTAFEDLSACVTLVVLPRLLSSTSIHRRHFHPQKGWLCLHFLRGSRTCYDLSLYH